MHFKLDKEKSVHLIQSHVVTWIKIFVSVLLMFQIPYSSASPGNYVVSTFGSFAHKNWCYILFEQWNYCPDVRKNPVYWPRSEHLELIPTPSTMHMPVFMREPAGSLAGLAFSTLLCFGICVWKLLQYSDHEESHPQLYTTCLNSQSFTGIVRTPLPRPTHHTKRLRKQKTLSQKQSGLDCRIKQ